MPDACNLQGVCRREPRGWCRNRPAWIMHLPMFGYWRVAFPACTVYGISLARFWSIAQPWSDAMRLLIQLLALSVMFVSCAPATAQFHQCNDGNDNNANSWIDMADPYCKLPDDNDETTFLSGYPGDDINQPKALDTWFDLDSGSGNDTCSIHACCMIDGACPADLQPQFFNPGACSVTSTCIDFALPVTKAGCDAFGCCEICLPGASNCPTVFVNPVVSPTCTLETIGDPTHCRVCTQNPQTYVLSHIFKDGFESAPAPPSSSALPAH